MTNTNKKSENRKDFALTAIGFFYGAAMTLLVVTDIVTENNKTTIRVPFSEQAQDAFRRGKGDTLELNKAFIKVRNEEIKNALDSTKLPQNQPVSMPGAH